MEVYVDFHAFSRLAGRFVFRRPIVPPRTEGLSNHLFRVPLLSRFAWRRMTRKNLWVVLAFG